jgi:predicted GNAT family N-acyltransferase
MMTVRAITIADPEYQEVYRLRNELLRLPLGLSLDDEDLSDDAKDTIWIAEEGGKIEGCVMMHPIDDNTIKLRQMAVHKAAQGTGVGRELVAAAEQGALQQGYKKIVLHARITAIGFYEKMHYQVTSDTFTEVGIPHQKMEKILHP